MPSDLGELLLPLGELWQQWERGVEKVEELVELHPIHMRLCDMCLEELRRAHAKWKACEVKVQVAARAVAASKK